MNSLNSVLIEGMFDGFKDRPGDTEGVVRFVILSQRFDKAGEDLVKTVIPVEIETTGKLAGACLKALVKGRGIRAVGHLKLVDDKLVVFAEHVEFKPVACEPAEAQP